MTVSITDLPAEKAKQTAASRLREAREKLGMSRSALAEKVGISAKIIEHYENGNSEPPITRLKNLAEALGVATGYILYGKAEPLTEHALKPKTGKPNVEDNDLSRFEGALDRLTELRENWADGYERKLEALLEETLRLSKFLSFDELWALGISRGFDHDATADQHSELLEFIATATDEDEIQEAKSRIEAIIEEVTNRLIDTAIIGEDLYKLDEEALKSFAAEHEISAQGLGLYWSGVEELVAQLRQTIRYLSVRGEPFAISHPQR